MIDKKLSPSVPGGVLSRSDARSHDGKGTNVAPRGQKAVLAGRGSDWIRRARVVGVAAWVLAGMAAGGCGRSPSSGSPGQGAENDPNRVVPPRIRPEYSFAEDLSRQYPEIVAIVQQFLETCLAGDYAGYRRLTSRMCDPESRERFQTVMEAIRSLRIQSIEPIPRPQLADEVFRVVSEVAFHPGSKVRLRRKANELAMLVLKEEGEWRIMPAPAELQPGQPAATDTSSAPASGPSYPWDEEGGS